MVRRTGAALAVVATLVFGTGALTPASAATAGCRAGTTDDHGLCVASSSTAQQAADVVQSSFTDDHLGAAVVGVWKNGKPLGPDHRRDAGRHHAGAQSRATHQRRELTVPTVNAASGPPRSARSAGPCHR